MGARPTAGRLRLIARKLTRSAMAVRARARGGRCRPWRLSGGDDGDAADGRGWGRLQGRGLDAELGAESGRQEDGRVNAVPGSGSTEDAGKGRHGGGGGPAVDGDAGTATAVTVGWTGWLREMGARGELELASAAGHDGRARRARRAPRSTGYQGVERKSARVGSAGQE